MADPTITTLTIRDSGGTVQDIPTVSYGGNLYPAHMPYGWDGSATPHPIMVDSAGRPLIAGPQTAGSAPVGGGLRMMGSDGTDARDIATNTGGLIVPALTRFGQAQKTFTPSTSYSTSNNFGGLFDFDLSAVVGAAVVQMRLRSLIMVVSYASSVGVTNMEAFVYNAAPSTSFTDAATPTYNSGDNSKIQYFGSLVIPSSGAFVGMNMFSLVPSKSEGEAMLTTSAGHLPIALICTGNDAFTTPGVACLTLNYAY